MRLLRPFSLAILLVFAPLTISADGALEANEACAFAGMCCPEAGSTCVNGGKVKEGGYYSETTCANQQ